MQYSTGMGNLPPHWFLAKGQAQLPVFSNRQTSAAVAGLSSSKHLPEAVQEDVSPPPQVRGG